MNDEIKIALFINELLIKDWPLIRKLSCIRPLNLGEIDALMTMHQQTRIINARKTFLNQGELNEQCLIITQGWAYRYRNFSNGDQQIILIIICLAILSIPFPQFCQKSTILSPVLHPCRYVHLAVMT